MGAHQDGAPASSVAATPDQPAEETTGAGGIGQGTNDAAWQIPVVTGAGGSASVAAGAGGSTMSTGGSQVTDRGAELKLTPTLAAMEAAIGCTADFVFKLENAGNASTGSLTATIKPAGSEFTVSGNSCSAGLAPLASCTIAVTFKPSMGGTKNVTLVASGAQDSAVPVSAALTGTALMGEDLWLRGITDFGAVVVGGSGAPASFTLSYNGCNNIFIDSVTTTDHQFKLGNDTCTGTTLPPRVGACGFSVTFAPATNARPELIAALLTVNGSGLTASHPMKGTAIGPPTLALSPNPLAFMEIPLNTQSEEKTLTVTNIGTTPTGAVTIPKSLGAGFSISKHTCLSSLDPGEACSIFIRFTPAATLQAAFTLTLASASGASGTVVLTGTGR